MTHSRNERRWPAVPAIGGLTAALLILVSCGREASSPVAPEVAVLSHSVMSDKEKDKDKKATLSVQLAGIGTGFVTSSPKGIACSAFDKHGGKGNDNKNADKGKDDQHLDDCSDTFKQGTVVTLTATATGGSAFISWGGACVGAGAVPTCTVTLTADASVTATFGKSVQLSVSETLNGTGTGAVTSPAVGIDCPGTCSALIPSNTSVTLTATPGASSSFVTWGGSCSAAGASPTCTLTMDAAKNVTATFQSYAVTVTPTFGVGSSGSVMSEPAGINCPSACVASFGSSVTLTANPDPTTSQFDGWTGACSGTSTTCLLPVDAIKAVGANFSAATPPPTTYFKFTITVVGGGDVTGLPGGDDCYNSTATAPHECGPYDVLAATTITLTANGLPVDEGGTTFVSWGGDGCKDITDPTKYSTDPICVVTMTGAKSVTANFTGGPTTASLARTESGPSLLRSINSTSAKVDQATTRSAVIEQQR